MDGNLYTSDGKVLATAAAQLKVFNSSDYKKIQKFSGHPVSPIFIFYISYGVRFYFNSLLSISLICGVVCLSLYILFSLGSLTGSCLLHDIY